MAASLKLQTTRVVLTLFIAAIVAYANQAPDRATCQRVTKCNGDMCASVCEKGSVQVDAWAEKSLRFQRQLKADDSILTLEIPGTHNAYQSQWTGVGVEEPFTHKLFVDANYADNSVVLVNQRYSLTDLLNMGIRHLEIDIWWVPGRNYISLCHDPGADPRFTSAVNTASDSLGRPRPNWDPENLGCYGQNTDRLETGLNEIRDWLAKPGNSKEFVFIYFDTKFVGDSQKVTWIIDALFQSFGSKLFTKADKNYHFPTKWPSLNELFALGKQVLAENNADYWNSVPVAAEAVFTPTIWSAAQFGKGSFRPYPDCTVNGRFYFGSEFIRALDTSIAKGPVSQPNRDSMLSTQDMANFAACGVNFIAMDQVQHDYIQHYIWSWDKDEPRSSSACGYMKANGRWASTSCTSSFQAACMSQSDSNTWVLSNTASAYDKVVCPSGYRFSAPRNGYSNSRLKSVAGGRTVWVAVRV
eukprot:TRINITY_DN16152_c0_g1_i1.p1 TRINITY_DN16152_c0_g1~~TRINITY_DN16152_c0_g1_i1.p1  ORF type:complete len:470 (-),score=87.47 TRINITY_DN16152_c0_g1_i1:142-1551(-)